MRCLLIEQGVEISREFYIGMLVNRSMRRVCLVASAEGGMDIEEVAEKTPKRLKRHSSIRFPASPLRRRRMSRKASALDRQR
jgi:succinyl-CoA synthetase beta subunit